MAAINDRTVFTFKRNRLAILATARELDAFKIHPRCEFDRVAGPSLVERLLNGDRPVGRDMNVVGGGSSHCDERCKHHQSSESDVLIYKTTMGQIKLLEI